MNVIVYQLVRPLTANEIVSVSASLACVLASVYPGICQVTMEEAVAILDGSFDPYENNYGMGAVQTWFACRWGTSIFKHHQFHWFEGFEIPRRIKRLIV